MRNIISWENPENLGKLPGSDWVCPLGDLTMLGDLALSGEHISDADITLLADGRPQHLNLIRYPEGYETVEVIDSATGKVLQEEGMNLNYFGLLDDSLTGALRPSTLPLLFQDWLPVHGRYLRPFFYHDRSGMKTTIGPNAVGDETSDIYKYGMLSNLHLQPSQRQLHMDIYGALPGFPDGETSLHIYDHAGKASGHLVLASRNLWREIGEFDLILDGEGRVNRITIKRPNILKLLDIETPVSFDARGYEGRVEKSADKASLLGEIAGRLGLSEWGDIDLAATAQSWYAAIPEEGAPNPLRHIQFR